MVKRDVKEDKITELRAVPLNYLHRQTIRIVVS